MSNERELFEKWFDNEYSNYGCSYKKTYSHDDDGYHSDFVDGLYQAWQASAQREGLVLVPVEPSEPAVKKLGNCIFDNFGTTKLEVKGCAILSYKTMIKEGSVK